MAYFLVDNPKDVYGMWIGLGCYKTEAKAKKMVDHLIETTGHSQIIYAKTGQWVELNEKVEPDRVTNVPVDMDGRLVKQHTKEIDKEIKAREERKVYEEELLREKQLESNPNTIDHYIHNWYNAIKNYSTKHHYEKQYKNSTDSFDKRVKAIREQYARQTEMETKWLDELKSRLVKRGESKFYEMIETGANELKEIIFGMDKSDITSSLDPLPTSVKSAPVEVKPEPIEVNPAPVEVNPAPVEVKPAPVEVKPAPVEVKPTPVEIKPTPVEVKPTPVEVKSEPKTVPELTEFFESIGTKESLESKPIPLEGLTVETLMKLIDIPEMKKS